MSFYGLRFELLEEDETLSTDTKAGGTLTRSIEIFRRYGVADEVLQKALRIDEIGDIDRATNQRRLSVETHILKEETRYPFVLNMPQHHLEPILERAIKRSPHGSISMGQRVVGLRQLADRVILEVETAAGRRSVEGRYVLACDGGRSTVRRLLNIATDGSTLEHLYLLIDVKVDLDIANPRDYPYLAYFSDRTEWMILVRQPHCWRFLFPVAKDAPELTTDDLRRKVAHFVGETSELTVLGKNLYTVHHRIAQEWRRDRVFLMGDAAHLITPMWQLGMNTGVLDASNLPWRLAWVLRGWADGSLLDGYVWEQRPIAVRRRRADGGERTEIHGQGGRNRRCDDGKQLGQRLYPRAAGRAPRRRSHGRHLDDQVEPRAAADRRPVSRLDGARARRPRAPHPRLQRG